MMRTTIKAACIVFCAFVSADGQQPIFRSGVDVVAVDVTVSDRDGRPVTDLQSDDFIVTVDGRQRRIVSVEYVAQAGPTSLAPAPERHASGLASYSSNEGATPGRMFMITVDQTNIRSGQGRQAFAAAERFLDSLSPSDRVGLATIPPPGPRVDFTTNRNAVRMALRRVAGWGNRFQGLHFMTLTEALEVERALMQGDGPVPAVVARECGQSPDITEFGMCRLRVEAEARDLVATTRQATRESLQAMRNLLESMGRVDGPKTMVLLTEGLVMEIGGGGELVTLSDLSWVASAAAASRVTIYALFLSSDGFDASQAGPTPNPIVDETLLRAGLDTLTGYAKGTTFKVVGSADPSFERIAVETSGFYLLGVEGETGDRDGKAHKINVTVKRSNVHARARAEFLSETHASLVPPDVQIGRMLASPLLDTVLPVRVAAYTTFDPQSPRLRLLVSVDVDRQATALNDFSFGFVLRDENGRAVSSSFETRTLEPTSAGFYHYTSAVLVDPGTYTLKLAAVDMGGRKGSIEHKITAGLSAGPGFQLSDLILVDPSMGDGLLPLVDGIVRGNLLATHVEVQFEGGEPPPDAEIAMQVADDEGGPALLHAPPRLGRRQRADRWTAEVDFDLSLLPPGDYVARAVMIEGGKTLARAVRPFRRVYTAPATPGAPLAPRAPLAFGAGKTLLRPFALDDVLGRDIVSYFVGRLRQSETPTPAVLAAADHAIDGRFDQVIAALPAGDTTSLSTTFLRGLALFSSGELERAAAEFRASLRAASEFLPAAFYLGACYAAGGRDKEAIGAWQTSLVSESEARIVYEMLADAYLRTNDVPALKDTLKEALERWPGDELFVPRVAASYAVAGNDGQAFRTLVPYLERHPDDQAALFLAMRLIFQAAQEGRSLLSPGEDRDRLKRYAALYTTAGGPEREVVARWVKFAEQQKR
jgi:VWFA-related protein